MRNNPENGEKVNVEIFVYDFFDPLSFTALIYRYYLETMIGIEWSNIS